MKYSVLAAVLTTLLQMLGPRVLLTFKKIVLVMACSLLE